MPSLACVATAFRRKGAAPRGRGFAGASPAGGRLPAEDPIMVPRHFTLLFVVGALAGPARTQCFTWKLVEAGGSAQDRFGMALLRQDDVLFVAEEAADASGRIHVYTEQPAGWVEITSFAPAGSRPGLRFGAALAASGDLLLAGSRDDDGSGVPGTGGAWIFARDRQATPTPLDDLWVEVQSLQISDPWTSRFFGGAVALGDGTALVGAPELLGAPQHAAAYVFERDDRGTKTPFDDLWLEQARLDPDPSTSSSSLGACVSLIDGGELALASDSRDRVGANGGVLLFARDGHGSSDPFDDTWSLAGQIDAPAGDALYDNFIVDGERLFAAGGFFEAGSSVRSPCIQIFERTGTAWNFTQRIEDSCDGRSMAADGDLLLTSVPGWEGGPAVRGSQVAVVARVAGTWTVQSILEAPDQAPTDGFGSALDLAGSRATLGAHGAPYVDDDQAVEGAVWFVELDEPNGWTALSDTSAPDPSLGGWGRLDGQSPVTVRVYDTFAAGSLVLLVVGTREVDWPIGNYLLVPSPDLLLPLVLGDLGDFAVSGIWPPGLPPGFSVWLQAWMPTGSPWWPWYVSNGLRVTQTSG
jgi:FG-GAP repeat protein